MPTTACVLASQAEEYLMYVRVRVDSALEELIGVGCAVVVLLLLLVLVLTLVARRHYKQRRRHSVTSPRVGDDVTQSVHVTPDVTVDNWSIPRPQPRVWQTSASMQSAGRL